MTCNHFVALNTTRPAAFLAALTSMFVPHQGGQPLVFRGPRMPHGRMAVARRGGGYLRVCIEGPVVDASQLERVDEHAGAPA